MDARSETVLRTEGLTKRYGDLLAVDRLSLSIREGEILGILGPNGAGKTTAINMICGLLRPDGGEVFIHGRPVTGGRVAVRTAVGMCPQSVVVWGKLTCLEQLQFIGELYGLPRREARRRGDVLLEAMGLGEKRDKLARTLSGGMQRRLNLIMALVHDPGILILDEPEAGLDPQSRVLVREYVKGLARKKTVILTTHNMDEADRLADRVAIIDRGKLLTLDTPEALKHQIGPGDVLEVEIQNRGGGELDRALAALADIAPLTSATDHSLVVRTRGAVERLPAILDVLGDAGLQTREIRLRENTLEDVFLTLTGRSLRE